MLTRQVFSFPRAMLTIFLSLFAVFGLTAASASAAGPEGSATMTLSYGKAGKVLNSNGVKIKPRGAADADRAKSKRVRVTMPARSVTVGDKARVALRGGLLLKKGKRKLTLRKLKFVGSSDKAIVRTKLGNKTITAFKGSGRPVIDPVAGTVELTGSKLKLTRKAAKQIKKRLGLKKRLPAARVGGISVTGQAAFEDPYIAECGLAATSKTAGNLPVASLPVLSGSVVTNGGPVTWGFKESFRGYINAIGNMQGLDGATVNRIPFLPPQVPPTGFTFPAGAGEFAANGAGTADDQAILPGSGAVLFCNQPHGFRIVLSNPTVVIDGTDSKIVADVDTNISGDWTPSQRVDLAELDLGAATANQVDPSTVTWTDIPAKLSQTGADALRLCEVNVPGAPPGCLYPAGTELDSLTVTASVGSGG